MIKTIVGINIAVKDLDEAIPKYKDLLGVEPEITSDPKNFAFPGLKAAGFFVGGVLISLLTTSEENNPVGQFLKKRGEGLLLVSLHSDDIAADTQLMTKSGLKFMIPEVFQGAYGKVNFIPAKTMNGVQWEILQPSDGFIAKLEESKS